MYRQIAVCAALLSMAGSTVQGQVPTRPTNPSARDSMALTPADVALAKRWAQLTFDVIARFRADDRDLSNAIETDYSKGLIRVRQPGRGQRWAERTISRRELAEADLKRVAEELYSGKGRS
jgi:hypothetical protein